MKLIYVIYEKDNKTKTIQLDIFFCVLCCIQGMVYNTLNHNKYKFDASTLFAFSIKDWKGKKDGRIVSRSVRYVKIAATDYLVQDVNFIIYKINWKFILILICTEIFSRKQDFRQFCKTFLIHINHG